MGEREKKLRDRHNNTTETFRWDERKQQETGAKKKEKENEKATLKKRCSEFELEGENLVDRLRTPVVVVFVGKRNNVWTNLINKKLDGREQRNLNKFEANKAEKLSQTTRRNRTLQACWRVATLLSRHVSETARSRSWGISDEAVHERYCAVVVSEQTCVLLLVGVVWVDTHTSSVQTEVSSVQG